MSMSLLHAAHARPLAAPLLMFDCAWIEGSRSFNIAFGLTTASVCLGIAVPTLWWVLPRSRVWLFPPNVDRRQGIQLAYGIFAMAMAFTDALCRLIPHGKLPLVHPAFFATTVILAGLVGPRVFYVFTRLARDGRSGSVARSGSADLIASGAGS
jgi:hypothetical protein